MRPLGKGIPRKPERPVVRPSKKMSQWKPGGLRRGNSVPWAMRDETLWSNQKRMVSRIAKGMARKTSPVETSQKWTNQGRSVVGEKAALVGSFSRCTSFMCPMWTKPEKKMIVRGVP